MTHWKKLFNSPYIGAHDLNGADLVLTIRFVQKEDVKGENGKTENLPVAHFEEDVKPMVLNKTNSKAIAAAYRTPMIEEWSGKMVTLYPTTTKLKGEVVECIRIRPTVPAVAKGKETLPPDRFAKMLESIKAGKFAVDKAKAKFDLTPEQIKQLESIQA